VPAECAGRVGIDNSGGFDRVRVRNGSIEGFEQSILLVRATRNTLAHLGVRTARFIDHFGSNAIALDHSDRNVLKDSEIFGGDPAVLLEGSDRNKITRTSIRGGISIRIGDGLAMQEGSDANTVVNSEVDGEGLAALIRDSTQNSVKRSTISATLFLFDANRTLVVDNDLFGGQGAGVDARGSRNTIRDNHISAGVVVSGDRNLIKANELVEGIASPPLRVTSGDRNVVRLNTATGSRAEPVITIGVGASRTSVIANSASGANGSGDPQSADGIRIAAPGSFVRGNTATDNDGLGINAVEGVIDGGDNRASGNGDPRQCVGVVCTP
jgi:hypothetical protein